MKVNFYHNELAPTIEDMYGLNELASFPIFQGGYINFGYWKDINLSRKLLVQDRIKSSEALYDIIFEEAEIDLYSRVLEIGCGLGKGLDRLLKYKEVASLTGIDIIPQHIKKAQDNLTKNSKKVNLILCDIEKKTLPLNNYTHIISVEAAQHFKNFKQTIRNISLGLKPGGTLLIVTFFRKTKNIKRLKSYIPDIDKSIGMGPTLEHLEKCLKTIGFFQIQIQSLGNHIWYGLDKWMSQQKDLENNWGRNWLTVYKKGLVDYYMIKAKKL